jgi:TPR repeat protein
MRVWECPLPRPQVRLGRPRRESKCSADFGWALSRLLIGDRAYPKAKLSTMKLKRVIAAIVLVSAYAAPVAAGTFEDAVDAHARGDYAKALRLIRPLANDGDASAQFNLGLMYTTGQGVQQDDAAAA